MNGRKNKTSNHFCYVRVSEYYGCFYKTKYGGEPIVFPEDDPLRIILEEHLCANPELKCLTPHSFSELAFDYENKGQILDAKVEVPSKKERSEFLRVEIPETVYRWGVQKKTSDCWQLSRDGASSFRKQIKRSFWSACMEFIDECKRRAQAMGESVTMESCISDFMMIYDIPMSHFENMIRAEQRNRQKLIPEVNKKRCAMEEMTGNVFIYT